VVEHAGREAVPPLWVVKDSMPTPQSASHSRLDKLFVSTYGYRCTAAHLSMPQILTCLYENFHMVEGVFSSHVEMQDFLIIKAAQASRTSWSI
jgi:hypothetical protein